MPDKSNPDKKKLKFVTKKRKGNKKKHKDNQDEGPEEPELKEFFPEIKETKNEPPDLPPPPAVQSHESQLSAKETGTTDLPSSLSIHPAEVQSQSTINLPDRKQTVGRTDVQNDSSAGTTELRSNIKKQPRPSSQSHHTALDRQIALEKSDLSSQPQVTWHNSVTDLAQQRAAKEKQRLLASKHKAGKTDSEELKDSSESSLQSQTRGSKKKFRRKRANKEVGYAFNFISSI